MNIRVVGIHSYSRQYISFVNTFASCPMTVSGICQQFLLTMAEEAFYP